MQAKCLTSCNDGAGADHLRQRELIYFYERSHYNEEKSVIHKTCPSMVESTDFSSPSLARKNRDDLASLSGYNGNSGAHVVLCNANKDPAPTFTRSQKSLVIEAWKHVRIKLEEVGN